jgi:trigger factor
MKGATMDLSVSLSDVAPCQKELKVQVPLDAVEAEFEAVYEQLKKSARVPGFRVGSAPRDLIEQHHGDAAREQVLKNLVNRSMDEALESHQELDLIGSPEVTDIQFEPKKPFSYTAKIEVAPKLPSANYKGFKLSKPKFEVTDKQLNEVIEKLREQQAELKDVAEARPAAAGDYLLIDLTEQKKGAAPVDRKDLVILMNLEKDPEKFLEKLVGIAIGEERTVTLKDDLAITVKLKGLKFRELPAVDDSFAKSVGPFESLTNLKESIQGNLKQEAERHQQHALEQAASEKLLETWSFDVPPSVVASQARRILNERAMQMMQQGTPADQLKAQADMLADQAKIEALKQVKLFFILRQIASNEKIEATKEEVEARVVSLAQGMGVPLEQFQKDIESREMMDELVWGIIRSKVLDLVIRAADVKEASK